MRDKLSFYFVLYLVALTTLLAVINERNIAMQGEKELIQKLVQNLQEKPVISVPDSVTWIVDRENTVPLMIRGLEHTQSSSRFAVKPLDRELPGSFKGEFEGDNTGSGLFVGTINASGRYRFRVSANVEKRLPDSFSPKIRERIARALGSTSLHLTTDTILYVTVAPEPLQFTLSVEKPVNDKSLVGIPYTKTIFVNGADTRVVSFTGYDSERFTLTRAIGRIHLTWHNPTVTASPMVVALRGDTQQGFGQKDIAETSFSVEILPPRWNPEPRSKAYWGVPFEVDNGVAGLGPSAYSIHVLANDILLKTITPYNFPDTLLPLKQWTSMTLRAMMDGKELLSRSIEVRKPEPPQQPRWKDQTFDGKDFVIMFDCADVNGGDVMVNLKVSHPEGFQARISASVGKSFTLRIPNVRDRNPAALEIQGTVQGIGGVREVRKTFSIFY